MINPFGIHCSVATGWRRVFCWLDNMVPHHEVPWEPPYDSEWESQQSDAVGHRGLQWVCRLHDRQMSNACSGEDDL